MLDVVPGEIADERWRSGRLAPATRRMKEKESRRIGDRGMERRQSPEWEKEAFERLM